MNTKNRIKTVLTAMAIVAIAATPAFADLAAGLTLDFNASDPASGVDDSNWNSLTADSSQDWDFGADVTLESVSTLHKITKAYHFTGGTADNSQGHWSGFEDNDDASWEFWLKPSDSGTLDAAQTLFESGGGGDGMSFWYEPGSIGDDQGTVKFTIDDSSVQSTVSAVIDTTEFSHITGVFDMNADGGTIDLMQIYVNGVLVDDNISATTTDDAANDDDPTGLGDWTGTNGGGLGNSNGNVGDTIGQGQYDGYMAVFRFWAVKALTAAEVEANFRVLGVTDPMEPSPADGAEISPSSTQVLSWTNLEPTTGSDVYVDVYFGTDANALGAFTTDPADGLNVTSVTVDASVIGQTYYWQVNSYINGSRTGDPNEGRLWTFYVVDFPLSLVDAGVDMITWYGQGVQLGATVEDDGVSALTYLWSAGPVSGASVVFSDETAEAPIATISKVPYAEAAITNAGFEADQQGEDGWGGIPGWNGAGNWNPPADSYTGSNVPEGQMCAWTTDTISQVLAETLASDTQYELTVQVGNSLRYDWTGYTVQLLAGGTVLNEDVDTVEVPLDSWVLVTVPFDSTGVDPELVGEPLEIRLLALDLAAPEYAECNFDDVLLTADPEFPPPDTATVELTVEVTDDVGSLADTMMIDVYGDACKAAIGAGLDPIEQTDHDGNCITGFEDLIRMVAVWLDDYSLTEAGVKP